MKKLFDVKMENHIVVLAKDTSEAISIAADCAYDEIPYFEATEVSLIEKRDDLPTGWDILSYPYTDSSIDKEIKIGELLPK